MIEIKKLTPELCEDWLGYFDGIALETTVNGLYVIVLKGI